MDPTTDLLMQARESVRKAREMGADPSLYAEERRLLAEAARIDDLSEGDCFEIADILKRKYSMNDGSVVGGEPFNVSRETMRAIVTDVWLITSGRAPLEEWRDEE